MKSFIGVKIVQAEPCNLGDYNQRRGWQIPSDENPARAGYIITYPDGYISWSPAEIFEGAYRTVSPDEAKVVVAGIPAPVETFLDRLNVEIEQLRERLRGLDRFLGTPTFGTLPAEQQRLMNQQADVMTTYLQILLQRRELVIGANEEPAAAVVHDFTEPTTAGQGNSYVDPDDNALEVRVTGGGSSEEPIPFGNHSAP